MSTPTSNASCGKRTASARRNTSSAEMDGASADFDCCAMAPGVVQASAARTANSSQPRRCRRVLHNLEANATLCPLAFAN
jgi:hypothetical protein